MANKVKPISIARAKEIAALGYDEVIIVGCNYETGIQHVTTFGKTVAACENAAKGGNAIKKLLGWDESKCNAKPKRVSKKDKEAIAREKDRMSYIDNEDEFGRTVYPGSH